MPIDACRLVALNPPCSGMLGLPLRPIESDIGIQLPFRRPLAPSCPGTPVRDTQQAIRWNDGQRECLHGSLPWRVLHGLGWASAPVAFGPWCPERLGWTVLESHAAWHSRTAFGMAFLDWRSDWHS